MSWFDSRYIQDLLILLSTRGYTPFRDSSSAEGTLRQRPQVWRALSKQVTWSAVSCALVCSHSTLEMVVIHNILGSISGLASQLTARQGNILGILGVSSGILSSLLAVGFPPEVLAQFAGVAGIGSIIGMRLSLTYFWLCNDFLDD